MNRPIGWIGTGRLGLSIASRLLDQNKKLIVYNRTIEKARPLERLGAILFDSLDPLIKSCNPIFLCLTDFTVINSLFNLDSDNSILYNTKGSCIINCGTVNYDQSLILYRKLTSRGIKYIDCPVSGGIAGAIAGTLVSLVSGDISAIKKYEGLIRSFSSKVIILKKPGQAQLLKLINNLSEVINLIAAAEIIDFSQSVGIELPILLDVLSSARGYSTYMKVLLEKIIKNDKNIDSTLSLRLNDINSIIGLLDKEKKEAFLPRIVKNIFEQTALEYGLQTDQSMCYEYIKKANKIRDKNGKNKV